MKLNSKKIYLNVFTFNRHDLICLLAFLFLVISFYLTAKIEQSVIGVDASDNNNSVVEEKTFLSNVKFINISKKEYYIIMANELLIKRNGKELLFLNPTGQFDVNKKKLSFIAMSGILENNNNLSLTNAFLKYSDLNLKSVSLKYKLNTYRIEAKQNVKLFYKSISSNKIKIKSEILRGDLSSQIYILSGNVNGELVPRYQYQQGISFASDLLKYYASSNKIDLFVNVVLTRDMLKAKASKGIFEFNNFTANRPYFYLIDNVSLKEKLFLNKDKKKFYWRKATCEKLSGYNVEKKILLKGDPSIYQLGDLIKGTAIIFRQNHDAIEVDNINSSFLLKKAGK